MNNEKSPGITLTPEEVREAIAGAKMTTTHTLSDEQIKHFVEQADGLYSDGSLILANQAIYAFARAIEAHALASQSNARDLKNDLMAAFEAVVRGTLDAGPLIDLDKTAQNIIDRHFKASAQEVPLTKEECDKGLETLNTVLDQLSKP